MGNEYFEEQVVIWGWGDMNRLIFLFSANSFDVFRFENSFETVHIGHGVKNSHALEHVKKGGATKRER